MKRRTDSSNICHRAFSVPFLERKVLQPQSTFRKYSGKQLFKLSPLRSCQGASYLCPNLKPSVSKIIKNDTCKIWIWMFHHPKTLQRQRNGVATQEEKTVCTNRRGAVVRPSWNRRGRAAGCPATEVSWTIFDSKRRFHRDCRGTFVLWKCRRTVMGGLLVALT